MVGNGGFARKSNAEQPLFAVHFANLTHGWIVGTNGLILHTTDGGKTWLRQQSTVNQSLRDVAFRDENRGWAVGEKGLILHTTDGGNMWSRYPTPAQYNLQDIHLHKNAGWIVGAKGDYSAELLRFEPHYNKTDRRCSTLYVHNL